MLKTIAQILVLSVILTITSACSTLAYKLYKGDPLPLDQVSLIKYEGDPWYAPGGVPVWTLDGCLRSRKGLSCTWAEAPSSPTERIRQASVLAPANGPQGMRIQLVTVVGGNYSIRQATQ